MSAFTLRRPAAQLRMPLTAPPQEEHFRDKYRPKVLGEITGNLDIVRQLRLFVANPHPRAFLFHGETGCGKSTAAYCLATELGAVDHGGLQVIRSATQDVETVKQAIKATRYTPFPVPGASGWHCIIVEEADRGSAQAKAFWLSALDDLSSRTVVVFTSNRPATFEQAFLDRCHGGVEFPTLLRDTLDAAQILADHIWLAETGSEDGPDVTALPNVIINGRISFGRVVNALEDRIRYGQ